MKTVSILGSTGSIGTQAIEVCFELGYKVSAIAANKNVDLLAEQAKLFSPQIICIFDHSKLDELKVKLVNININIANIKIVTGIEGLCACATEKSADIVINAVVGMIGLRPTLEAIAAKKDIALANKETLVTGGKLVIDAAKEHGVSIIPVDSEHSAIFQALHGNDLKQVKSVILTASGGPFFGKTKDELSNVTIKDALNHPNWSMGAKITVDSATLMNKGLELIEACWLFDKAPGDVSIVVHRESVIHSLVEYVDNAVIAQLGVPDMKLPIQYALTYPNRVVCKTERLSLVKYGKLTFYDVDMDTFICLKAAIHAIRQGGLYPTIVNGSNERAVELFLDGKISFLQIGEIVMSALGSVEVSKEYSLEGIIETDKRAREYVNHYLKCLQINI